MYGVKERIDCACAQSILVGLRKPRDSRVVPWKL